MALLTVQTVELVHHQTRVCVLPDLKVHDVQVNFPFLNSTVGDQDTVFFFCFVKNNF